MYKYIIQLKKFTITFFIFHYLCGQIFIFNVIYILYKF